MFQAPARKHMSTRTAAWNTCTAVWSSVKHLYVSLLIISLIGDTPVPKKEIINAKKKKADKQEHTARTSEQKTNKRKQESNKQKVVNKK